MAEETTVDTLPSEAPIEQPKLNRLGNWMTSTIASRDTTPQPNEPAADPEPDKQVGDATGEDATNRTADLQPATAPQSTVDKPAEGTAEPPEDKWPRSAQEWKKFRESRKKQVEEKEARIKALETELTEFKAKSTQPSVDPNEVENIKKERDTLSEELKKVKVTEHPKFKQYFESKTNAQVELAKRVVGPELADDVQKALLLPDGDARNNRIEEIMAGLGSIQQSRFGGILNALSEIDLEKQREIENYRANYDSIRKAEESRISAIKTGFEKSVSETLSAVQDAKAGMPQWQRREGDTEWNAGVEARMAQAKHLLSGTVNDPKLIIQTALDAVSFPVVLKENMSLRQELKKLEAQVAALSKANPAPAGEKRTSPQEGTPNMPAAKPGSRPMEVTQGWVKGLQAARNG